MCNVNIIHAKVRVTEVNVSVAEVKLTINEVKVASVRSTRTLLRFSIVFLR